MKKVNFLDYTIVNSGNSDGWVITKPNGERYECHLGNYSDLEQAKKYCVLYFMIHRPAVFSTNICYRTQGVDGTTHDYYLFTGQLKKEGLAIPVEINTSGGSLCGLLFKSQKLGDKLKTETFKPTANIELNQLRAAKKELEDHIETKGRLNNEQARDYSRQLRELNVAIEEAKNKTPDDCYSSDCCFNYNSKGCNINCKTYAKEEI